MLKLLIWGTQFSFLYTGSHMYLCGARSFLEHPACSVDQVLPYAQGFPKSASWFYLHSGTFYEVEVVIQVCR